MISLFSGLAMALTFVIVGLVSVVDKVVIKVVVVELRFEEESFK